MEVKISVSHETEIYSRNSIRVQLWGPQHKEGMELLKQIQSRATKMIRVL